MHNPPVAHDVLIGDGDGDGDEQVFADKPYNPITLAAEAKETFSCGSDGEQLVATIASATIKTLPDVGRLYYKPTNDGDDADAEYVLIDQPDTTVPAVDGQVKLYYSVETSELTLDGGDDAQLEDLATCSFTYTVASRAAFNLLGETSKYPPVSGLDRAHTTTPELGSSSSGESGAATLPSASAGDEAQSVGMQYSEMAESQVSAFSISFGFILLLIFYLSRSSPSFGNHAHHIAHIFV